MVKRTALVGILIVLALVSPAAASTVNINDSEVKAGDVTVGDNESNNNRQVEQNQSASTGDSNEQNVTVNQGGDTTAEGGDQNGNVGLVNANVSPAVAAPVNVAAPVTTGPINVLTNEQIDQNQSNTDNSRFSDDHSERSITINRSTLGSTGTANDASTIILRSSSDRVTRSGGERRGTTTFLIDSVGAIGKSLPRTGAGDHVIPGLVLAVLLIVSGAWMIRTGAPKVLAV